MTSSTTKSVVRRLFLPLIILAGCAIRVSALQGSSLWLDELIQVHMANQPLDKILATMFDHVNVPVDIILTKILLKFGSQEGWLRLSSAFFGTLSLPLMYSVARKLTPAPVPVLSMLLLAFSPLALQHNRELRPYSLLLMLTLLSVYLFLQALNRPRYWVGFVPALLLTLYTHLFAIAFVPVFGFYWLFWFLPSFKKSNQRWTLFLPPIMLGLVVLAYLISPFSPDYIGRIGAALVSGLGPTGGAQNAPPVRIAYTFPGMVELLKRLPYDFTGRFGEITLNGPLSISGIIFASLGVYRLRRPSRALSFLLIWLTVLPILIIFVLGQRDHWFSPRYIIQALPAMLIFIGAGLAQVGGWLGKLFERSDTIGSKQGVWIGTAAVTAVYLILVTPSLLASYHQPHENIRGSSDLSCRKLSAGRCGHSAGGHAISRSLSSC